jgi:hypothetical protein
MNTVTGNYSPEELALELDLPLLGALPDPAPRGGIVAATLPTDENERRDVARAAGRILLSPLIRDGVLGLVGDMNAASRARIASSVAALISAEKSTILVDADLRHACLSFDERGRAQEGLVDVLRYGVRSPRVVSPTRCPGLSLLPVGSGTVDFTGTYGSEATPSLFMELKRTGDLVLVNAPDIQDLSNAGPLLAEIQGWVLIHQAGASDPETTRTLRETLDPIKWVGLLVVAPATGESEEATAPAVGESVPETAPPAPRPAGEGLTREKDETDSVVGHGSGIVVDEPGRVAAPGPEPLGDEAAAKREVDSEDLSVLDRIGIPASPERPLERAVPGDEAATPEFSEAEDVEPELPIATPPPAPARSEGTPEDSEPVEGLEPGAVPEAEAQEAAEIPTAPPERGARWRMFTGIGLLVIAIAILVWAGLLDRAAGPASSPPALTTSGPARDAARPAGPAAGVTVPPESPKPDVGSGVATAGDGAEGATAGDEAEGAAAGDGAAVSEEGSQGAGEPEPTPVAVMPPADADRATPGTPTASSGGASSEAPATETPPETPIEPGTPTVTPGPRYGVHLSSLKGQDAARREAAAIEAAGFPTVTRRILVPDKGWWYRVYVGPYGDRESARSIAGEIKSTGFRKYAQVQRLPAEEDGGGSGREDR